MKNKNKNIDDYLKLSIIIGTTIIALSIAYYFVAFLPQKENRKVEMEKEEINSKKQEQEYKLKKLEECIENINQKSEEKWNKWCLIENKKEGCSMSKERYDEIVKFKENEQEKCYQLYR